MAMQAKQLKNTHQAIRDWYHSHGRKDLPWRNSRDPYAIWVSEIMLQQTQVTTVRDRFYGPFLAKFPTAKALAMAPENDVMKAWEGLGYYRRARHLHQAAKRITKFPNQVDELILLPGIGKNTAHAIMAFAFHAPVAVMEANVKRIVARVFAIENPRAEDLWHAAEKLLNREDPFLHNQAMMDIGAMICTPRNPRCGECPLQNICTGKIAPENYPAKKAKKAVAVRKRYILVRQNPRGEVALEKREGNLLGGLYGFEQVDVKPAGRYLGEVRHHYSHFTLEARVYVSRKAAGKALWKSPHALHDIALSALDHKVLKLLAGH